MRVTILLADDHMVARRGLRAMLGEEFPQAEFGMAASASEVMNLLASRFWHLVVLDLSMPGSSGLDTIERIKEANPRTRVLVFTTYPEDQLGVRAIQAGADGFLTKQCSATQLFEAVKRVLEGHRYVSPTLAERLADMVSRPQSEGLGSLSNREIYVLRRIGQGKATGEIAGELGLSIKTVSTYRSRVLEKLKLGTTADLVRFAIEHDLTR